MAKKLAAREQAEVKPTVFTIFGITGDLSKKYLLTALYNLAEQGELSDPFYLAGYGRRDWDNEQFKAFLEESLRAGVQGYKPEVAAKLFDNASYINGDFATSADYVSLKVYLDSVEKKVGKHLNKIFYLATAPLYYPEIFKQLGACGLAHSTKLEQTRIMVEKPFGSDEASAAELNKILHRSFTEDQIFRVDHYLGKLPIQNLLSFRFGNGLLEKVWNARHIDNIQISAVMEDLGIDGRGAFYDQTGALLDVVQNHILQMVALVCMDAPESLDSDSIHDRKKQVLNKIRIVNDKRYVVRGQYKGYRQEKDVDPSSDTETFVALKLFVDTPRFRGVPIYVRTGKRVDRRYTDVLVQFKQDGIGFLGNTKHAVGANVLSIRVQPEESISLRIMVRKPGFALQLQPAQMDFCYTGTGYHPGAYEKIMYDALRGDQLSLVRSDVLMQQWRIIDALKKQWKKYPLEFYAPGTEGPSSQDRMLARDGTEWWSEAMPYCPVPQQPVK